MQANPLSLRECLINLSYGQQSILLDFFVLEQYTAIFKDAGNIDSPRKVQVQVTAMDTQLHELPHTHF